MFTSIACNSPKLSSYFISSFRSVLARTIVSGLMLMSASAYSADPPYATDFEAEEGFSEGPLPVSFSEWSYDDSSTSVDVVTSDSASGQQSLAITGSSPLIFNPSDTSAGQVHWIDFYVKPVFLDSAQSPGTIDTLQSAVFAFVKSGATGTLQVLDGDSQGGGFWVASASSYALNGNKSSNWVRLTYRLDYASETWSLFVDEQLEFTDLGFLDGTFNTLSDFSIASNTADSTGLDFFYAGAANPLYSEHRPYLHAARVSGVDSNTWTSITLPRPYKNPIVVATPVYDNTTDLPAVVRIRGLVPGTSNFELRVQNPSDTLLTDFAVEYLVVEAGVYKASIHGVDLEAGAIAIGHFNRKSSWTTQNPLFLNAEITDPVVIGQVMTSVNDAWSVFWSHGVDQTSAAGSEINLGLHIAEDTNHARDPETVGYVVMDATNGIIEGRSYEADVTGDFIVQGSYTFAVDSGAITELVNLIAVQAGMDGGDGRWLHLAEPNAITSSQFTLATDEDQISDNERVGATEQAAYLALGSTNAVDSNADGIPDWWQQWYVDRNPFDSISSIDAVTTLLDQDSDGVSDYIEDVQEGTDFTNPYDNSASGPLVYVDALNGSDQNTGRAPVQLTPLDGPKQTLSAGLEIARDAETIELSSGIYDQSTINLNDRRLTLRLSGAATIQ